MSEVRWADEGLSNFDRHIPATLAQNLHDGMLAEYCAWNFHGILSWNGTQFQCIVSQYHAVVATIKADSLQEITEECCGRFGSS